MINKKLLLYAAKVKAGLIEAVILKYILFASNLLFVWFGAKTVETLMQSGDKGELASNLAVFAAVAASVAVIRCLINIEEARNSFRTAVKVQTDIRNDIYGKILDLGIGYLDKADSSSLVSLAVEGVEMLEVYFARYLPQLFYSMTVPFVLFAILFSFDRAAPSVMVASVWLIPVSIVFFMKKAKKIMRNFRNTYEEMSGNFLENIQGLTTLKLYNRDGDVSEIMAKNSEIFRKRTMKVLSIQLSSIFIMDFFSLLGAATGILAVVNSFSQGNATLSGTVTILLLSAEFFLPMRILGALFHSGMNGVAAFENISDFICQTSSVHNNSGNAIPENIESVVFDDLTFSYDGKRDVLKNVSFEIKKGERIAVVGSSGSGKSTIGSLILRIFEAEKGKIRINGRDIPEFDTQALRNKIALISQQTYIFDSTIRKNLALAKSDATEEEMLDALSIADLDSFVLSLPEKLDSKTGEWGSLFSGGQKQRIAIARAILKESSFYIFDEATSNVDASSEAEIWKNIYEISANKTTLIITHRLSMIKNCDKIIVLEKGRIVESGKHEKLMENRGLYFKMFSEQSLLESNGEKS